MTGRLRSSMHLMANHSVEGELDSGDARAPWIPKDPADKEAIREQLGRILSSVLFRNSKRFPLFLRYTVEHALSSTDSLKERTIGHEVFGRDPGYDTAQDPVVRMTATEVRKRLSQYYQLTEHAAEPLITYQPGSYVPEFFVAPRREVPEAAPAMETTPPAPRPSPTTRKWLGGAVVASVFSLLAWAAVTRSGTAGPGDAVGRFWSPVLASPAPVLICIGDPSRVRQGSDGADDPASPKPDGPTIDEFLRANSVRYTDSVTLALLVGELRVREKPFRIRRPAATELKDLREGPVVLIGGFNNPWTVKLSEGLRFTLAADDGGTYVRDRNDPDNRQWQPGASKRLLRNLEHTYGLITRVQDPATGHWVLTVSGLVLGTRAAGECLIDSACLETAERLAPSDWSQRNIQIVVSSAVIGEDSGAPRVVALHTW